MAEAIVKDANLVVDQKAFTQIISSLNAINSSIQSMGTITEKQKEKLEDIEEEQEKTSGGIGSFLINFLRGQKAQKQSDGILKKTFGGVMSIYKGLKKGILGTLLASLALLGIAWVLDYLQKLDLKQLREDIEKLVDEWYPKAQKYLKQIKKKWDQAVEDFNNFFGGDITGWLETISRFSFVLPRLYGAGKGVITMLRAFRNSLFSAAGWIRSVNDRIVQFFKKPPSPKLTGITQLARSVSNLVFQMFKSITLAMVELGSRGSKKFMKLLGLDETGVTRQRMRQMVRSVRSIATRAMFAIRTWANSTAAKIADASSDLYKMLIKPLQIVWVTARSKLVALGVAGIRVTRDSWGSFISLIDEIAKTQKLKWVTLADDLGKMGMTQAFADWKMSFNSQMTRIREFVHNPFKGRLGFIDEIVKSIRSITGTTSATTQAAGKIAQTANLASKGGMALRFGGAGTTIPDETTKMKNLFQPVVDGFADVTKLAKPYVQTIKTGITSIFGGAFTATGYVASKTVTGALQLAAISLKPFVLMAGFLGRPIFQVIFSIMDAIDGAMNADKLMMKAEKDVTFSDRIASAFAGVFGGFLRAGEMIYEFFGGKESDYAEVMTGRFARFFSVLFDLSAQDWMSIINVDGMANDLARIGVFFHGWGLKLESMFTGFLNYLFTLPVIGGMLKKGAPELSATVSANANTALARSMAFDFAQEQIDAAKELGETLKTESDIAKLVNKEGTGLFQKIMKAETLAGIDTETSAMNIKEMFQSIMSRTDIGREQQIQLWNQMANNMSQINTTVSKNEAYTLLGMQVTNGRDAYNEFYIRQSGMGNRY